MASCVSLWGKNGFHGLLCFSLLFFLCSGLRACLSLAMVVSVCSGRNLVYIYIYNIRFPVHSIALCLYYMLPYLPFCSSPYPPFTTVLVSRSPLLGWRRELFSWSLDFLTCSSCLSECLLYFSPHYCCFLWVLSGHTILIVSSLFPYCATCIV